MVKYYQRQYKQRNVDPIESQDCNWKHFITVNCWLGVRFFSKQGAFFFAKNHHPLWSGGNQLACFIDLISAEVMSEEWWKQIGTIREGFKVSWWDLEMSLLHKTANSGWTFCQIRNLLFVSTELWCEGVSAIGWCPVKFIHCLAIFALKCGQQTGKPKWQVNYCRATTFDLIFLGIILLTFFTRNIKVKTKD